MHWNFPLVIWPWISHSDNVGWMLLGIMCFVIFGVALLFGASQEASKKHNPSTPEQVRPFYYVSLALFGTALVTLILGAWVTIPVCAIVAGLIIFSMIRSLVRAFGYAFLGWPKPESSS